MKLSGDSRLAEELTGETFFKAIAKLFGKSENWACVTYHRAKNRIKERAPQMTQAPAQVL